MHVKLKRIVSLLMYLDAAKCVLLSIFTLIETNFQKNSETLLPCNAKWPLPVDVPYYLKYFLFRL